MLGFVPEHWCSMFHRDGKSWDRSVTKSGSLKEHDIADSHLTHQLPYILLLTWQNLNLSIMYVASPDNGLEFFFYTFNSLKGHGL
jgi:hypothetical protein